MNESNLAIWIFLYYNLRRPDLETLPNNIEKLFNCRNIGKETKKNEYGFIEKSWNLLSKLYKAKKYNFIYNVIYFNRIRWLFTKGTHSHKEYHIRKKEYNCKIIRDIEFFISISTFEKTNHELFLFPRISKTFNELSINLRNYYRVIISIHQLEKLKHVAQILGNLWK